MNLHLSALHLYPIKSCAPLMQRQAQVEPRGLAGDRRWMIVDEDDRFITGRQQPRLVLVSAEAMAAGLRLAAPGMPPCEVRVPPADAPRRRVSVWRSQVQAQEAEAAAQDWISRFLGQPCRLVYMDQTARRPVDPAYGRPGDEVSFADGFPLLLISQASLDGLNARLAQPVSMLRFRPNLVVAGPLAPHAEDGWKRVRVGAIEFDVVKPCTRCVFTTVIPERGVFDTSGEPLRTLRTYRRTAEGVNFGQNLIARGIGLLRLGDPVCLL
jgi:uncharacterized protein YcbX